MHHGIYSTEWSRDFSQRELNQILDIISQNQQALTEWYREFFS